MSVLNDVCSISSPDLFKSFAKIYAGLVPDQKSKSTDTKSLCQNIRKRGFVKYALNDTSPNKLGVIEGNVKLPRSIPMQDMAGFLKLDNKTVYWVSSDEHIQKLQKSSLFERVPHIYISEDKNLDEFVRGDDDVSSVGCLFSKSTESGATRDKKEEEEEKGTKKKKKQLTLPCPTTEIQYTTSAELIELVELGKFKDQKFLPAYEWSKQKRKEAGFGVSNHEWFNCMLKHYIFLQLYSKLSAGIAN